MKIICKPIPLTIERFLDTYPMLFMCITLRKARYLTLMVILHAKFKIIMCSVAWLGDRFEKDFNKVENKKKNEFE